MSGESNARLEAGQIFEFGAYPQKRRPGGFFGLIGKYPAEPVKWRVLEVEGDRALVVSVCGLDCRRYNDELCPVTWETSSLRKWLNGEFYDRAFGDEEKSRILEVKVVNAKHPKYETDPGRDTDDRIFCLSYDEVSRCFNSNSDRLCGATDYAVKRGAKAGKSADMPVAYWLRSPSRDSSIAATVSSSGAFANEYVYGPANAVRPAMYVKI